MDKKAVSAVIGVILMVAITVAIAATVYVYVSSQIQHDDENVIDGILTESYKLEQVDPLSGNLEEYLIIKLEDGTNITCNKWEEDASKIVLNEDNFGKKVRLTFETKIISQIINKDKYLIDAEVI